MLILSNWSTAPFCSISSVLELSNISISNFGKQNIIRNSIAELHNESSLCMHSSAFSSLAVQTAYPLAASGNIDNFFMMECTFRNISHRSPNTVNKQFFLKTKESSVVGCEVSRVENPFCSVLVIGRPLSSFVCRNTSFSACTVTEHNRRVFDSSDGDVVIEQTTFNVESKQSNGGTIYASGTKSFTIRECFFDRCNNTHPEGYGNVLHLTDVGPLLIQRCSVEKCVAVGREGFMRTVNNMYSVSVTDLNASQCEAGLRGVGIIYGSTSPIVCSSFKMIQSESRGGEAGALMLCGSFSSLIVTDLLCDSNYAASFGGGIEFMRDDNIAVNAPKFSCCIFINNSARFGNDIAFTEKYFDLINSSCFLCCFSLSEQNRVWMCTQGFRACTSGEERNSLLPNPSGTVIHVDPMRESGDKLSFGNAPFVAISGSASADFDALDANGMTTTGSDGLISVDSTGTTTINNSTFHSSNLTSSAFVASSSGTYSLTAKNTTFEEIKRTAGDGSCVFLNTRSGFASSFTASNCTFTKCTVTENGKGGGAIGLHISSQSALTLESSAFTSCQAPKPSAGSKGKGGAVLIDFSEVNTRYLLANTLIFASNTAEHGNDLFVSSVDLASSITTAAFQFFLQDTPFAAESCAGTDSKWPSVAIPLVFYLLPRESDVHVLSEGNDVSACGFADYGCQTIAFALTQRTDESGELIVHPVYALSETITLSGANEITFEGTVAETRMRMIGTQTGAAEAMIRMEQASTWKHLAFCLQPTIPSPQSSVFLVCSANAMLNLEECSALAEQSEEKCAFGFLTVAEGSFAMTRFTVNSIGFQSAEMVKVCSKGSGAIESCTWTNVTSAVETGIIAYSSAGTLSMHNTTISQSASSCCSFVEDKHGKSLVAENNTFSGITKNEGNGSVIKADIGENESLELNDVSVDSCSSVRGCGGGVYISTSSTAKVRIGKEGTATRFARCSAKGTLPKCGFGGGVFLKCADWLADLVLTAVSFGTDGDSASNEAEGGGSNVFVEGHSLDKIITNQSFKFNIDKESTAEFGKLCGFEDGNVSYAIPLVVFLLTFEPPAIAGGNTGFDYRMCGVSIYPCATIPFAISKRFPASNSSGASIRLTADFSFRDAISFDTQPTEVSAEQIGGIIDVRSDGMGEGAGLLCSSVNVKFSEIVFGLPGLFDEPSRTSLFLCLSATLTIHRCEFQNSSSSAVEYRIIFVTNGKVELNGCKMKDFAMGNAGIIALDGSDAECAIEGMEASKLSREGEGALLLAVRGKKFGIENSSIENTTMANSSHIAIYSLANGLLKNVTFSNLSRINGDGGVIVGELGAGEVLGVENCSFKLCGCYSARTIGGCVLMDVEEGGTFRFERNKVEFCIVSSGDGYGGGLFLTFASSHLDYSMRNNTFENNGALRGKDAYVVCEEPGAAILLMYWNGSASEDNAPDRLWVRRLSEPADGGATMIDYLFPPPTSFVFVDGCASAVENCGSKRNPCTSVELGFQKMDSTHSIIQLEGNTPVDAVVNRHGVSLTIQSNATTKAMIFGTSGKFELVEGSRSTTLTFSRLGFVLPSSPNPSPEMSSLVEVSIGQCSFLDCTFEQGSSSNSNPSKWIVSGVGGVVHFDSCTFSNIPFQAAGVVLIDGALLLLEACSFSSISSDARKGLITGSGNCDITLKDTGFENCETTNGHMLEMTRPKSVEISGACTFEGCTSTEGDGEALCCVLEGEGSLVMNKTSIVSCGVNAVNGRGGGIYLDLKENVNVFLFSDLTFSRNEAFEGKDMFVRSADLNASIIPSLFDFEYFGADGETKVDLKGRDETHFVSVSADLLYFLVKYSSSTISVGSAGIDFIGCGKAETPCHSLWRGINNLQASEVSQSCFVEILDEVTIDECFEIGLSQLSIGLPAAAASPAFAKLSISQTAGGSSQSIFSSNNSLSFCSVQFHLPAFFSNGQSSVVSSSDGYLTFNSTSFHSDATSVLEYVLLSNKGGTAELLNVSVSSLVFVNCPFALSSYATLEECCFHNICSPTGTEGGAMSVCLERSDLLRVKSCRAELCKCSTGRGRGGFLHIDCSKSAAAKPFRFEGNMAFEANDAQQGRNMFIVSENLNSSVSLATFAFSFEAMKSDSNAFVGKEGEDELWDLFRYLVPYSASTIHLSDAGTDVMRCGSADDPCCSFWKGMQQISSEASPKLISIAKSTEVANTFTLSNFTIQSSLLAEDEMATSKLSFGEKAGDSMDPFFRCADELMLKCVSLIISSSFNNSAAALVQCEGGVLSLAQCVFGTEAGLGGMRQSRCSFVACLKGKLSLVDVSVESASISKSAIVVGSAVCEIINFTCSFVNISDGGVLEVVEVIELVKGVNAYEKSRITVASSAIASVTRTDNGAAVIDSNTESGVVVVDVNSSTISDCKAGQSQKGGAVFVKLTADGSFSVVKSAMLRCCCSDEGKGGAFYVDSMGNGALHLLFQGVSFTGNTAKVGNDIFVSCHSISAQINETQFRFDLREGVYVRQNAIYGIDTTDHTTDTNLMDFITIYQADTVVACSLPESRGRNERQCGTHLLPCLSLDYAIAHVTADFESRLVVEGASVIEDELTLDSLLLASRSKSSGTISISSLATQASEAVITTLNTVVITNLCFVFGQQFSSSHSSFISPGSGVAELTNCSFSSDSALPLFPLLCFSKGDGVLNGCLFSSLSLKSSVVIASSSCSVAITSTRFTSISSAGSVISCENSRDAAISHTTFTNNTLSSSSTSSSTTLSAASVGRLTLANCSMSGWPSMLKRGILAKLSLCNNVMFDQCYFEAIVEDKISSRRNFSPQELCRWNGSLVEIASSTAAMKDTSFANSPEGGLSVCGGSTTIEKGEFANNNPSIEGYPSARRNIVCGDAGSLDVMSLKGGDGVLPNTSMWILNEGCTVGGMAEERESVFFIPRLDGVEAEDDGGETTLKFHGSLLLPCNLWFQMATTVGSASSMAAHQFEADGFAGEGEAVGVLPSGAIRSAPEEAEVSVCILFGRIDSPSSTESFVLKNRSESEIKGDGRIVEGGKEGKSSSSTVIIIVLVVILLIVLIASILVTIRWRKQKRRTEELEVIVEDTVKKDPKAFEMVTMEMSPEEQWRRAEREAEKKNEERIKKRVYEKSLRHSESSEHLLSESVSTEYILGRDSDKIPEWMLEKVDEKEDDASRKRTPSPSISSTSTTSTTDSDSTFVRSESLCPTTSSMSNLVDAMACSSPHEKLIVDLRDSLFMLLHGRNEKKEMAIGTFQEREYTAVQILFWVANLALHSFDEMDNPLSSLANLSPHIVLFSEHMVICIAMHSDFSSDDSDSSSISSSTVVTSASDDDDESDSLPSSAFENEDSFKKECLRWKAPELLMNKKMGATKESVAFSIGMMLWECLTLKIPFGEYEAEVAGQKIVNGERPSMNAIEESSKVDIVKMCLEQNSQNRASLIDLRKEFIQYFPPLTAMLTATDAIQFESDYGGCNYRSSGISGKDKSAKGKQTERIKTEKSVRKN
ncbi:uncharacterized protein MONOS_7234 [Monocercomonoides exilis]|uniref:uncharacterized protein n=1 Tax=Monocercomonoides exilis TaxID=2049356 RepID=UPI003559F34A|nr:hypothetical protein MONOS_7234 [Monocercomonoides exilis]|eukprot:MONOS_7234.1-p1 / transcript=MONOS_7234.1 / gene=MONOS_7234 / organism=Monocercomonoides_exilis_PA203 / gene_product=unspecified product / transcript_product=unspecified product / location=Mono_scaffold00242:39136-50738(+) / protein_length=3487 / sequence_SO=supercontig / SO=protein_coding / is_pseudo=false